MALKSTHWQRQERRESRSVLPRLADWAVKLIMWWNREEQEGDILARLKLFWMLTLYISQLGCLGIGVWTFYGEKNPAGGCFYLLIALAPDILKSARKY